MPPHPRLTRPRSLQALLVAAGLLIGLVEVARGQVGGDQLNLLARGWLLAARGEWIHYGNPLSSGGNAPGTVTTVLVAAPLTLWSDARAPAALILLLHLGAYLLLDRVVRQAAGESSRTPFAILYWLNPWQLYFAGFVWNPNYLFVAGALHLWTAWRQRAVAGAGSTFLHVATLGLAAQVHPSVLLLMVASVLLWWRGLMRVHWGGFAAGVAATLLSVVPWWLTARDQPAIATVTEGFLLRGLVLVFPLIKGALYWLRYGSLQLGNKITVYDFASVAGPLSDRILSTAGDLIRYVVGPLTLLVPLAANARLWRGRRRIRQLLGPTPRGRALGGRSWLARYAAWSFVAALVVFALSPTTLQMWQVLVLLHAAVLPILLAWTALLRGRHRQRARRALFGWAGAEIVTLLLLAFGSPFYRPGGRGGVHLPLRADSPMLHQLNIVPRCPIPVDQPGGWWPDVLPEE